MYKMKKKLLYLWILCGVSLFLALLPALTHAQVFPSQVEQDNGKQKKKKKKQSSSSVYTPYDEEGEGTNGGVLSNPQGFEGYGSAPTVEPEYLQPTPSEKPKKSKNKDSKKTSTDKKTTDNGEVLSVNLGTLYNIQMDTVLITDKRKALSFKAKEDIKYYYNQAVLKINNKDYINAEKFLNKSLAKDPYNKELLQLRANVLTELEKFKKAVKDYRTAIKIEPSNPILHYNMASALFKMGKLEDAIASYDQAIALKKDYWLAILGRASANTLLKRYKPAVDDYNEVLELKTFFLPALKGRGVAKSLMNHYDEAIGDFSSVIELQPTDGLAHYYRGLAYISDNQLYKGCADLEKAYQLSIAKAYNDIKELCR